MAKYWLFLDNQVTGPYGAEELHKLPGFSPEALICPEGRKGTDMGDWQRAELVPELKASSQFSAPAVATQEEIESPFFALKPDASPSSAGEDANDKVSSLEMAFGGLHDQLRKDEDDMLNLHRILDDERTSLDQWVRDLSAKMSKMEEKIGGTLENSHKEFEDFKRDAEQARLTLLSKIQEMEQSVSLVSSIQDDLKAAKQAQQEQLEAERAQKEQIDAVERAQKETESLARGEAQTIDDLKRRIEELQAEIALLRGKAFGIGAAPGQELSGAPESANMPEPQAALETSASTSAPMAAPAPAVEPAPGFEAGASNAALEPPSFGDFSLPPFSPQNPMPAQPEGGTLESSTVAAGLSLPDTAILPSGAAGAVEMAAQPKRAKSGKAKAFIWIGLVLLAAGALFAFEEGLIPLGMNKAASPIHQSGTQASVPAPAPSQSELIEEAFKKQAIALVQNWGLPSGKTVGSILGPMAAASGNLNPWMAEKASDGVYYVNFYGSQSQGVGANGANSQGSPVQSYQFEARLDDRQVIGINKAAQDLLAPPPPRVKPHRRTHAHRKKVVRIRRMVQPSQASVQPAGPAQDAQLFNNLLTATKSATPVAPVANTPPAPAQGQPSASQPQPQAQQTQNSGQQNGQTQDSQLDNLLKP